MPIRRDENEDLQGLRETIEQLVRGGYTPGDEIAGEAVEITEFEGDEARAEELVVEAVQQLKTEQARWPSTTDYDRLRAAFADLESQGVVCRENFSCCGTCGSAEIGEEMEEAEARGNTVIGYAFFHMQDTERAVEGGGLFFNYGAIGAGKAAAEVVGRLIAHAMKQQGLLTTWNGSVSTRVQVALDWKRRWPEETAGEARVH